MRNLLLKIIILFLASPVFGIGNLRIESEIPADIYLDNKFIGNTPLIIRADSAGQHILRVIAANRNPRQYRFNFEPGGEPRRLVVTFDVWELDNGQPGGYTVFSGTNGFPGGYTGPAPGYDPNLGAFSNNSANLARQNGANAVANFLLQAISQQRVRRCR